MDEDEDFIEDELGEKGKVYEGTIRSYRAASDYGFIMTDEISKDVYFRSDSLPTDFKAGIGLCPVEGLEVTYKLHKLPDGKPQAKQIQVLGTEGRSMMGTVKSFNMKGGYGFIVSSALEGDLYFDKREVPPHINPNSMTGLHARFELAHDERRGKYKAVDCVFKNELPLGPPGQLGPPGHPYGDMPFSWPPPIDHMSLPFPQAGFPPGHAWHPLAPGPSPLPMPTGPSSGGGAMVGEVKSCNPKTGYGFLTSRSFHSDIYFRNRDVVGNTELLPGQQVSFSLRYREDGHPIAKDISLFDSRYGPLVAAPYNPDNADKKKRKRTGRRGNAKRGKVESQEDANSGAYVATGASQARPRPSSSIDKLSGAPGKELFGVISTEFERVKGYGYLICDETGEEIPFSDSNSAFAEGEEVAFRIEYGPENELLAERLRLLDP